MARKEEQRSALVQAVLELCDGRSMSELSLLEVQVHSGLSSSTLHQLFPSKAELMAAAFAAYHANLLIELSADTWRADLNEADPGATIAAFVRRYMEHCARNIAKSTTWADAVRVYPGLAESRNRFDEAVTGAITEAVWSCIEGKSQATKRELEHLIWVIGAIGGRTFGPPSPIQDRMNASVEEMIELAVGMCLRSLGLSV